MKRNRRKKVAAAPPPVVDITPPANECKPPEPDHTEYLFHHRTNERGFNDWGVSNARHLAIRAHRETMDDSKTIGVYRLVGLIHVDTVIREVLAT